MKKRNGAAIGACAHAHSRPSSRHRRTRRVRHGLAVSRLGVLTALGFMSRLSAFGAGRGNLQVILAASKMMGAKLG